MFPEKTKVRISSFVSLIIENDCQLYRFIDCNDRPNKNDLLNKLIPNLLELKKNRRDKIKSAISDFSSNDYSDNLYNTINMFIDDIYFCDEELDVLDDNIWIRPQKQYLSCFNEIEESELKITCLDLSSYLRNLLNEYSRFPQYKRGAILFKKELEIIKQGILTHQMIGFTYNNHSYKVYCYQYMYGFYISKRII